MLTDPTERRLAADVSALVHADDVISAARSVVDFCRLDLRVEKPGLATEVLQNYLHHLLNAGGPEEAASILWTKNQFTSEPKFTKDLWKFFDEVNTGLIMGASSCSKSFGIGVRLMLEWIRDPMWTTIKVVGPSEAHLEQNLFSHLVSLHKTAKLPMPGEIGELFIGMDRRDQLSSIHGLVIPKGQTKKSGRIQGTKRKPRVNPHPVFGNRSRMFIFIDEIENVPAGVWKDLGNALSQVDEEGEVGGFKVFGAYNPTNQHDEVGKRAEPVFGWEHFDLSQHFRWKSKRGWEVLRLDGEQSENVKQGKILFEGLQSQAGLNRIATDAGGRETAGYYSMGRGAYPPSGISLTIIPPGMVPKIRGEYIWYDTPVAVGGCDLALDGGDAAVFTLGKWGRATGMKLPPSVEHPNGHTVMFKDKYQKVQPRWGLQVEGQFTLPKGETVAMKDSVIDFAQRAMVRPEFLCLDETGHTRGVVDLVKYEWSEAVHGVNYSDGSSETKIAEEDTKTCKESYDRMCAELWFATRKFAEFGYLLLSPSMDLSTLTPQLTQRKSKPAGKQTKVEPKREYSDRTGQPSPDEADSLTLLVHAVRTGANFVMSMKPGDGNTHREGDEDDGWYDGNGGCRIDASNRTDYLDYGT
jgi:hypothetical protein